ncbi:hypothetical protein SAMN04244573_03196 [Azotobacter beijerinckii]|uniref:Uncharacterized protein n=1 Tax=Azotobacter beijerinckii TaxID=170623 RepID=A0A1H9MMV1_9GAMM|nr:hypothetical protein [Azotobacter beijerinckii]SER25022.1 hypothetical protein SAMN04244573_03196 [Azotobacter beijerinckii]
MFLIEETREETLAVKATAAGKPVAKRKTPDRPRTFDDTRIAARGGEAAFEYFVKHGKLPVSK